MKIDPPARRRYRGPYPIYRDYRKINRKERREAFLEEILSTAFSGTLHPNSTDCLAIKRINSSIPGSALIGSETNTNLTSGELAIISTDDANHHLASSVTNYAGHRIAIKLPGTDISAFTITAKGYGTGGDAAEGWQLYIWNAATESWGSALDSHELDSKQTLTATIDSGVANYIDTNDFINILCTAHTGTELAGSGSYLYYFELTV